jgi:putative FmdB family regulatory protein
MPIYEYNCDKCGVFEVTQRITENPLRKCPTCKGKVERIISHTSFVLKGSGWYATDYARSGASKPDSSADSTSISSEASNGSANSSTSTAKTEPAKPASSEKTTSKTAD